MEGERKKEKRERDIEKEGGSERKKKRRIKKEKYR